MLPSNGAANVCCSWDECEDEADLEDFLERMGLLKIHSRKTVVNIMHKQAKEEAAAAVRVIHLGLRDGCGQLWRILLAALLMPPQMFAYLGMRLVCRGFQQQCTLAART